MEDVQALRERVEQQQQEIAALRQQLAVTASPQPEDVPPPAFPALERFCTRMEQLDELDKTFGLMWRVLKSVCAGHEGLPVRLPCPPTPTRGIQVEWGGMGLVDVHDTLAAVRAAR